MEIIVLIVLSKTLMVQGFIISTKRNGECFLLGNWNKTNESSVFFLNFKIFINIKYNLNILQFYICMIISLIFIATMKSGATYVIAFYCIPSNYTNSRFNQDFQMLLCLPGECICGGDMTWNGWQRRQQVNTSGNLSNRHIVYVYGFL